MYRHLYLKCIIYSSAYITTALQVACVFDTSHENLLDDLSRALLTDLSSEAYIDYAAGDSSAIM